MKRIGFLSFLIFVSSLRLFSQTILIKGNVSTPTEIVKNARITFTDEEDTTKSYTTLTDSLGNYSIGLITSIKEKPSLIPAKFELAQNYPNPFSSSTAIMYKLNEQSDIQVTIYDILGREVKTFKIGETGVGNHIIKWDGKNNLGSRLAAGIYFYQLVSGNQTIVKKMVMGIGATNISQLSTPSVSHVYKKLEKPSACKAEAETFIVQIKNTNSTTPRIMDKEFNDILIENDTTLNFVVQEEKVYADLSGRITKKDSPFYIDGAARVPKGEKLIIEPGVIVLFKAGNVEYRDSCDYDWNDSTISIGFLRVDGKLIAEGTKTDSIIFTKASNMDNHYWGCIYFSETSDSSSIISFSRIEYASTISGIDPRVHGDGITCWFSNITLKSNLVLSCKDFGIYLQNSESLVENNIVKNCLYGVGTWAFDQYAYLQPVIRNNIIIKNSARGLLIFKPQPLIENNVICYNEDIGILLGYELLGKSQIINNIIWANKNFQVKIDSSSVYNPDITYSCIENGWSGEGNIDTDPKFIDITIEDFHLLPDSPCINSGSTLQQYNDHDGSRNDMGAYGGSYGDW